MLFYTSKKRRKKVVGVRGTEPHVGLAWLQPVFVRLYFSMTIKS